MSSDTTDRQLAMLRAAEEAGEVVNVVSSHDEAGVRLLSNFAPTPFELDGRRYPSIEAFWASMRYPEGSRERERLARMTPAWKVKKAVQRVRWPETITYEGRSYRTASAAHHALVERAIRAKVAQNRAVREALVATGDARITHVVVNANGNVSRDSYSLPRAVFTDILTRLRSELVEGRFEADMALPLANGDERQIELL